MKLYTIICMTCLLSIYVYKGMADSTNTYREWKSMRGSVITAAFEKVQAKKVYLSTEDGRNIKIRKSSLCADDQTYIDSLSTPAEEKVDHKDTESTGEESEPLLDDIFHEYLGKELRTASGKKVSVDTLAGKTVGLYFSAHWCGPCRRFTPKLVEFYNELKKNNKPFEIVFISSDRSEDGMEEYMKEMDMPWLALPYGDEHKVILSTEFGVKTIPTLVILSPTGFAVTEQGVSVVSQQGTNAFENWDFSQK